MGHMINYHTFEVSKDFIEDKKHIYIELDEYARRNSDSGSGLYEHIHFYDNVCASYDDAVAFIEKKDNGWYGQYAVKYREAVGQPKTKHFQTLQERREALEKRKNEYVKAHAANAVKAEFIGCKNCGSKIAKKYLTFNNCPICRADLRSEAVKAQISKMSAEVGKVTEAIAEEMKKYAEKNGKIKWLVKTEIHV